MSIETTLYEFMLKEGVDPGTARSAAQECGRRIMADAALGFGAGVFIGLCTSNPGTLIMGLAMGAGGAAIAVLGSPSCQDLRDAATRLATGR